MFRARFFLLLLSCAVRMKSKRLCELQHKYILRAESFNVNFSPSSCVCCMLRMRFDLISYVLLRFYIFFALALSLATFCLFFVCARAPCTSIHFIICWFLNSLLIFAVFLLRSLDSGKVIIYRKFNKCFCSFSLNLEFLKLRNAINASQCKFIVKKIANFWTIKLSNYHINV